ncbi:D-alanyl-D-alanine carboxypeptidase family protein [Cryobacterium sp. AP23]
MSANGRLTDAELTAVRGGRLSNTAAAAWNAMVAAAAKDGVSLVIASAGTGNGAYRDFFTQVDMKVRPWLYGLSVYSTVNVAAAGHSTHGMGNAVDIGSFPPASNTRLYGDAGATRRDWVLKNAHRFGFTRTFGEADPNHFGHDGSRTTVTSFEATPIQLTPTDWNEDMQTVLRDQTKDLFNIWPAGIKHLSKENQASISAKVQYDDDEWLVVTDADFGDLLDAYAIPRDQVYGIGKVPAGHVWSAAGNALASANEAVRIGNENHKRLNAILAKLK